MSRHKTIAQREADMFDVLGVLVNWTNDGSYTHASDLFRRAQDSCQLVFMERVGYVEHTAYPDCNGEKWWRLTDKGRAVYNAMVFARAFKEVWVFKDKADEKIVVTDPFEKYCPGCHRTKTLGAYIRDKSRPSGIKSRCRECINKYKRQMRSKWLAEAA
jgi:hypothetical protein